MTTNLVRLAPEELADDFGVYVAGRDAMRYEGPFDTPLMFRGTFDECIAWRRDNS